MNYRVILGLLLVLVACGQAKPTPEANADATFAVALERSACFGTCSAYTVHVNASGAVTFDGRDFVAQPGIHTDTLSPEELNQLGTLVDGAGIFEMKDEYMVQATDLPSTVVTVTRNGVTKSVLHYGIGCLGGPNADMSGGAPAALCRLQTGIDAITNVEQWVK